MQDVLEIFRDHVIRNGFLLMIPVLLWNAIFWPRLPVSAGGRGALPRWLKITETTLRAAVFVAPVFLSITTASPIRDSGVVLYLVGLLVYFLSWIPWLRGRELEHRIALLGPYVTPLAVFGGVAVLCGSPAYFALSAAFVAAHAWVGVIKGSTV